MERMEMAYIDWQTLPASPPDTAEPTASRSIWHWIVRRIEARRTRRQASELMALNDRMLADIGLTRGDVTRLARGGWGMLP